MTARFVAGALFALAVATCVAPAAAELYEWTDANGVRHYTSDLGSIPEAYRPGARDIGSPRPREAPAVDTRREDGADIMRFASGAPIVAPVLINGVGLRFMVDTGADRTMVSRAAAARAGLGADGGRPVRIVGVAGSALASEVSVAQIEVAGTRVGPLRLVIHDTPGDHLDGLLGRDVLDHFTLTVDSSAGRATLTPRAAEPRAR